MRVERIGDATLYLADCLDVLSDVEAGAVVSDPPYGANWDATASRFTGGESRGSHETPWKDPKIKGDDEPFDPAPFLGFDEVILWGSNYYAQRLPAGRTLVWIKKNDAAFGAFLGDAEVAWMKGGHSVLCHRDLSMNGKGANFPSLHPAQKPEGLMEWCVSLCRSEVVFDPYMGSGTTGVACAKLGRRFVGVEMVPEYFEVALDRVGAAYRQVGLF